VIKTCSEKQIIKVTPNKLNMSNFKNGGERELESLRIENKKLKTELLQIENFVQFLLMEKKKNRNDGYSERCDCRALDMLVSRFYNGSSKFPLPQTFDDQIPTT